LDEGGILFSATFLLSFKVGVNSPPGREKSIGTKRHFLI